MNAEDIRSLAENANVQASYILGKRIETTTAAALMMLADVVEQGLLVEAYIGNDDETGGAFWEAMKRLEALKP